MAVETVTVTVTEVDVVVAAEDEAVDVMDAAVAVVVDAAEGPRTVFLTCKTRTPFPHCNDSCEE